MKNKIDCPILLLALLVSAVLLTSCKIMMPSDYRRAKEIVTRESEKVGLHGKVTINHLDWTPLEIPTYNVNYTYSEKTYDGQTVTLEQNTSYHDGGSNSPSLPYYEYVFVEQKSVKKIEEKIENKLMKQSIGLPIKFFSIQSNVYGDSKEEMLNALVSQNIKEGKKDFAGHYQIPFQTLIDQELVEMTIFLDDVASIKEQDLKDAAKKIDAKDLPDGNYRLTYYSYKSESDTSLNYSFKVKDGKVIFYEDQREEIEGDE